MWQFCISNQSIATVAFVDRFDNKDIKYWCDNWCEYLFFPWLQFEMHRIVINIAIALTARQNKKSKKTNN